MLTHNRSRRAKLWSPLQNDFPRVLVVIVLECWLLISRHVTGSITNFWAVESGLISNCPIEGGSQLSTALPDVSLYLLKELLEENFDLRTSTSLHPLLVVN